MSIGHSPHVEGHKPDMRKDEANITETERQDARRRIEGSMAPEMDGMGLTGSDIATDDKAMSSLHPANIA
jgi:phosphatidylserine decarboxylase